MKRLSILHTHAYPASTHSHWFPDDTTVREMVDSLTPMLGDCTIVGLDRDNPPMPVWIEHNGSYLASINVDERTS